MNEKFMEEALKLAKKAAEREEVPVGAVIVKDGEVIARAFNKRRNPADATGHAEIAAIKKACKKTGDFRLSGCDLYVTLEPCPMCAGAIALTRPDAVIFGARDDRAGCCGSVYRLTEDSRLGLHTVPAHGGVLADECAAVLSEFFKSRRPSE